MRIYLDNCCYNRPFDRQGGVAVVIEALAKLQIQALMHSGAVEYVKPKDALHLASAESVACDWFLTTDKGILKKVRELGTLRVANPVEFMVTERNDD